MIYDMSKFLMELLYLSKQELENKRTFNITWLFKGIEKFYDELKEEQKNGVFKEHDEEIESELVVSEKFMDMKAEFMLERDHSKNVKNIKNFLH